MKLMLYSSQNDFQVRLLPEEELFTQSNVLFQPRLVMEDFLECCFSFQHSPCSGQEEAGRSEPTRHIPPWRSESCYLPMQVCSNQTPAKCTCLHRVALSLHQFESELTLPSFKQEAVSLLSWDVTSSET